MKKIILLICILTMTLFAYDNYDARILNEFKANNLELDFTYEANQKYPDDENYPDLVVRKAKKVILKRYSYEGAKAEVKYVYFNEKQSIVAILVGWRTIHKAAGIDGEFYELTLFKLISNNSIEIKKISGLDGYGEGNKVDKETGYTIGKPISFIYKKENEIKKLVEKINILEELNSQIKNKMINLNINAIKNILKEIKISKNTLVNYNNIAYYLEKAKAYPESIYLLEKILKKYPNRTVAYINLGDAYWGLANKEKAKQAYSTYIKQMKEKGKKRKIPKVVLERIK
ncbi:tetratricopeptide repeat protein [Sulfurimonas sp.]|uniref:tetratricopeptide repeat protein n=1 Tax=Sulfurimonas sp. TaxID=2022749 RepID=UPI002B472405|nr:tetratricopeptide repeat protein [Sulfurimonas sp.]